VDGGADYEALRARAEADPNVLAFWLGGSRGMGRATAYSDYDCFVVVAADAYAAFKAELGLDGHYRMDWRPGIDLIAVTLPMIEAWPGRDYTFAHVSGMLDKTGVVRPLLQSKGCVPPSEVAQSIHNALDHALNQAYRALKCERDGDAAASRFEAAEGVTPFLDAAFALHGGRLRPFYKYLAWELATHPLDRLPFGAEALRERLLAVLAPGAATALSGLLAESEPAFRAAGHAKAYDGWEATLPWILAGRPVGKP